MLVPGMRRRCAACVRPDLRPAHSPPLCDIPQGFYGGLGSHPLFPSHAESGRCVLSAAAASAPAGVVSAVAEPSGWCAGAVLDVAGAVCALALPSSWCTGGCAGCCGGRLTVFAAHAPPHCGRSPPALPRFRVREAQVPPPPRAHRPISSPPPHLHTLSIRPGSAVETAGDGSGTCRQPCSPHERHPTPRSRGLFIGTKTRALRRVSNGLAAAVTEDGP